MNAYIYCADLWCRFCIRESLHILGATYTEQTEDMLREVLLAHDLDPNNESTWDSDELPKGPIEHGGGHADRPQVCACCEVFLENPLTEEGYRYLAGAIKSIDRDDQSEIAEHIYEMIDEWHEFYKPEIDQYLTEKQGT